MLEAPPLTAQDEPLGESFFQDIPLHRRPLLEEIVLGVHAFGDQVPATLKLQLVAGKLDLDVRPIDLLQNNQRIIWEEPNRFPLAKMFLVRSPSRPKQTRHLGMLHESTFSSKG